MKNSHIKLCTLHLIKDDLDKFTQICNREGVGKSEVLRRFVKNIVKKGEV